MGSGFCPTPKARETASSCTQLLAVPKHPLLQLRLHVGRCADARQPWGLASQAKANDVAEVVVKRLDLGVQTGAAVDLVVDQDVRIDNW